MKYQRLRAFRALSRFYFAFNLGKHRENLRRRFFRRDKISEQNAKAAKKAYFLRRAPASSKTFISSIKQQPKSPVWLLYIVPTPSLNVNLGAAKKV